LEELTKAQKGRIAIRTFKTTADALALRGYYKPSGRSGQTLEESLKSLSPDIYGTMNDHRIIELKGLEYVMDRLPRGIEECSRIILTAEENFEETAFEKIIPSKRRRISYRVSEKEMSFIITRGMSEIYDILTHLTFLNIEAHKIKNQMKDETGRLTPEWELLEKNAGSDEITGSDLDRAIWNLSIILGRTFNETKETYTYMESERKNNKTNNGLFKIIYNLGCRALKDDTVREDMLMISFTPSLRDLIGRHKYGRTWATMVKKRLYDSGLHIRPVHIISANMHSVMNSLYSYAALNSKDIVNDKNLYNFIAETRGFKDEVKNFALDHGLTELLDTTGFYIDCQIIDTVKINGIPLHPDIKINKTGERPVIIVMDYAFGSQAYEVMEELLSPLHIDEKVVHFNYQSISIMGKAGILPGRKGDIMLASAHVFEGNPHNYIVNNDLSEDDFDGSIPVYTGPIVTVLGTSLQNRDVLDRFQTTSWKAIGLEMEGGHYHRAISASIIRGHIPADTKVRYAYYASDNPLISGQTLSSGPLGEEGIKPTYMITRVILEKIFAEKTD
jgi:hypothetical protein